MTLDENGKAIIVPIKKRVFLGCQIEYTKVEVNGKIWYSFAVEWFGDKQIPLDDKYLDSILDVTELNVGDSMGYGEFLNAESVR